MKTLTVRMSRHCENGAAVALFLAGHPAVARVHYPGLPDHPGHEVAAKQMRGFGGMVSFRHAGGEEAAVAMCGRTRLFTLGESLGRVESLIEHPGRMTHASAAGSPLEVPGDLTPRQAQRAVSAGAVLVDIRPAAQRAAEGEIPGALIIERNVLEWRFDPASAARLPQASYDAQVIVFCSESCTSSLAAAALQDLGVRNATDLAGGFMAWQAAGLPVVPGDYAGNVPVTCR